MKLPPMPIGIERLPRAANGYPIPWFVDRQADKPDGQPDFRIADGRKRAFAAAKYVCWICGRPLRRMGAFVIGPMCSINRVSADPPMHPECAHWSVRACPFLSQPRRHRDTRDMPEGRVTDGVMIERNPGVALVWQTTKWSTFPVQGAGFLFDVGEPIHVEWYARGREATRAEILESIRSGLPLLQAEAEREGPEALAELALRTMVAMEYVPGPLNRSRHGRWPDRAQVEALLTAS